MLDEIIKKKTLVLHANQKTVFLPLEIKSSNLERKHHRLNYFGLGY
jgi:hypothetical protein